MAPIVPIEFIGQKESRKFLTAQAMGKSRKFSSKGPFTGFVSDYRHAVETTAETEGFGSSGRIDTEMTPLDNSYGHKRKHISLNVDGSDTFQIPIQLLSVSKLSGAERKDMKCKLQKELEQVQNLQRRLSSLSSNTALSPSSDMRNSNPGLGRPLLDGALGYGTSKVVSNGKKRVAPSRNGQRTKKGKFVRSGVTKAGQTATNDMLMKQCGALLKQLMSHQHGWVFNTPVDVVKLNLPDYFNVIKYPMDLGTVKNKLDSGEYSSPLGFAADVRLTFSNAMTYNPRGNDVHLMAEVLSKNFESKWKAIEKKISVAADVQEVPSYPYLHENEAPSLKNNKSMSNSAHKPGPDMQKMTDDEKNKLSMELESLLGELPENIIEFLKAQSSGANQTSEDEIEIDINALGDVTLLKLRKLLDDYIMEKQKNRCCAEACDIELHNASGTSNSSLPQCIGNEAVEEDVDIVGEDDTPRSVAPPVVIEKDTSNGNGDRGGLSSSSSDSDSSSSSDSDAGSSYESEPDAAKASGTEVLCNGVSVDEKNSGAGNLDDGNCVPSIQLDSEPKPNSNDTAAPHEEERAPPERQVSPEKLYRAALLRNRFADTILKAQETTLEKDDKGDPEKLRLQREELERWLREEKAKLQAEAKAAEEARKKAEEKAAADAKKKREMERELARQALLQMEKTVDINESSQYMEDLELLQVANDGSMPSFSEECPADASENGLGGFKFQGYALKNLGLYMKADEEEDLLESEPGPATETGPPLEPELEPEDKQITPPEDSEAGEID